MTPTHPQPPPATLLSPSSDAAAGAAPAASSLHPSPPLPALPPPPAPLAPLASSPPLPSLPPPPTSPPRRGRATTSVAAAAVLCGGSVCVSEVKLLNIV